MPEVENDTRQQVEPQQPEPCILFSATCPNPAAWNLVHHCCGRQWACCDQHKAAYAKAHTLEDFDRTRCTGCGTHFIPYIETHWEPIP